MLSSFISSWFYGSDTSEKEDEQLENGIVETTDDESSSTSTDEDSQENQVDPLIFLGKYFSVGSFETVRKSRIPIEDFLSIGSRAFEILKKEPTLIRIDGPCNVIGSVRGQFNHLVKNFNIRKFQAPDEKYILLGKFINEFTDRTNNLHALYFILSLKVAFPDQYILLRGDSERYFEPEPKRVNRLADLVNRSYGEENGELLFSIIMDVFSSLPLACLMSKRVLMVSGGISPHLQSLEDIENIQRPLLEITKNQLALDLTSATPMTDNNRNGPLFTRDGPEKPCKFSEQAAMKTAIALSFGTLIRAGRVTPEVTDGYEWSPRYFWCSVTTAQENATKLGAIVKISAAREISFVGFRSRDMSSASDPEDPE